MLVGEMTASLHLLSGLPYGGLTSLPRSPVAETFSPGLR